MTPAQPELNAGRAYRTRELARRGKNPARQREPLAQVQSCRKTAVGSDRHSRSARRHDSLWPCRHSYNRGTAGTYSRRETACASPGSSTRAAGRPSCPGRLRTSAGHIRGSGFVSSVTAADGDQLAPAGDDHSRRALCVPALKASWPSSGCHSARPVPRSQPSRAHRAPGPSYLLLGGRAETGALLDRET